MAKADDNITRFPTPVAPPAPPNVVKIDDAYVFMKICDWKIARAKQTIMLAEQDKVTVGGLQEEPDGFVFNTDALDAMHFAEYDISLCTRRTVLTARAMLEMATEILAYAGVDQEHNFAAGPTLDIVRNTMKALEELPGGMNLDPAKRKVKKDRKTP